MFKRSLSWFILVFTLLEFVAKTQLTTYDGSHHGFLNNNHDRYLAKEISSIQDELTDIPGVMINSKLNSKLQIKFNPEILDFKQRHLGMPHLEKVMLFNIDSNYSVDMTSISGSTVHFHSSFFENKKIPPLGNTSFNVVFLGREEGSVESNLFIHTTQGHFKYRVKGDSVFSPYRLRPIVNVKLPLNASFSPIIYFHNPFQEAVQIVEIYCSGGDFHLELPSGEMEGPKDMWEVAPFETKAIIRVRFVGEAEQNHTSYVRIKLSNSEDVLVVPLEIQVVSEAILYAPQGYVDFGIGGSRDPPRTRRLSLCNPFKKSLRIASINTGSDSMSVQLLEAAKLIPAMKDDQVRCVEVAKLVLNCNTAFENKDFYGKIVVRYKNANRKTEVPYYATIIDGGITFNASQTTYFIHHGGGVKLERPEQRRIAVRNDFRTPVKLLNVSLPSEARHYFQIMDFSPIVLRHAEERVVFALKFHAGVQWTHMKLNAFIQLHTNISTLHLPLVSYDGKLDLTLPHKSKDNSLDLGLISVESTKDAFILVVNKNPIGIDIKQVTTSIPSGVVELLGCGRGRHDAALLQASYANMTKCSRLKTSEYAILKLTVRSARSETQIWGDISVNTQFEQLSIPVHFKIAAGKLEIGPDRLVFDQCFPYKICSHPLRIHSSYDHPMVIEDLLSIPPDERLTCRHSGHILGRATKLVGQLLLDPNKRCKQECYLGIQDAETRVYWRKSVALPPASTCDLDLNLVNILYHRYLNETAHGAAQWQNLTLRLDTSEVKGHLFQTRVKMSWPSLVVNETFENKSGVVFPLTQVGNTTYRNVTLRNPSSFELIVQVVMDAFYPHFDVLFEGLPPVFVSHSHDTFVRGRHGFFLQLPATENAQFPTAHKKALTLQLKPNEERTFSVGFKAVDSTPNMGFLVIRNNLTIVEMVQLSGRGALPHFKFGNRRPGSSQQPLLFEFGEKQLKDCDLAGKAKKGSMPVISLKRSFTAKNHGEIPIFINNFLINTLVCEGYGFKVLNCEPVTLLPNATKKIDIEFMPDFTLAKITRTLFIETSLNLPVNYTLVTTVPPYYLSLCSSALERPVWEYSIFILATVTMVFSLTIVLVVGVIDSDKICMDTVYLLAPHNNVQHTLDLRSIGAQTRQELQTVKAELSEPRPKSPVREPETKEEEKAEPCLKTDGEKYTAVVPTTGKMKKKNRKPSEQQERERENHRRQWMEAQKLKHEELREEGCTKKHLKKHHAHVQPKKSDVVKVSVPIATVISEEETSSSTTSTHSNEEKKFGKKQAGHQAKSMESGAPCFHEKENVYHPNYPLTNLNHKTPLHNHREKSGKGRGKYQQTEKQASVAIEKDLEKSTVEKVHIEKVKPNRRERREKMTPAHTYKHHNGERHERVKPERENLYIPPNRISPSPQVLNQSVSSASPHQPDSKPASPAPSAVWNENKASFSDVVCRSETPSTPSPVIMKSPSITKPTMYVEPYKQAFVPPSQSPVQMPQQPQANHSHSHTHQHKQKLAPIGSRGRWADNTSDYTRFFNEAIESTKWFLDVDQGHSHSQPQSHSQHNLHNANTNATCHSNPWSLNASPRASPSFSQPAMSSSTTWENPLYGEPAVNDNSAAVNNSNILWGSTVWEPWTPPPVQDTWTPAGLRTPPGFAPAPQRSQDDDLASLIDQPMAPPPATQQQQGLERNGAYNPFGFRIWQATQAADPWQPRGQ